MGATMRKKMMTWRMFWPIRKSWRRPKWAVLVSKVISLMQSEWRKTPGKLSAKVRMWWPRQIASNSYTPTLAPLVRTSLRCDVWIDHEIFCHSWQTSYTDTGEKAYTCQDKVETITLVLHKHEVPWDQSAKNPFDWSRPIANGAMNAFLPLDLQGTILFVYTQVPADLNMCLHKEMTCRAEWISHKVRLHAVRTDLIDENL